MTWLVVSSTEKHRAASTVNAMPHALAWDVAEIEAEGVMGEGDN
jgi:hypothetical protein